MYLRTSHMSPFGRKIRMALHHVGLGEVPVHNTNFLDPADPLRTENPLGKMPVLTLDDGRHVYDSRVIIQYLDLLVPGKLLPADPDRRIAVLKREALCDGICDAGVLIVMEGRMRPADKSHQPWIDHQRAKLVRGFAAIAADLPYPETIDAGTIALAAMLAWVEIRKPADWTDGHPEFREWLDRFAAAMPAFALTAPHV
ncbi:glutathione S-transferase family protein [Novosphingobium sp. BL-52-GroH]|uniref:glutathione S-transferase family protein n=1 Tax=Novosphingobium sp. BL-52-GroH TaxID=3349877 RepID=UPI00384F1ABB